MSFVKMSDAAYKEFEKVLQDNNIETNVVRIILSGMGCGGPNFGLILDEQKDTDNVTEINETTFLVDKELSTKYGVLTIKSGEENGYGGLSIEPEISVGGGCSGCSGCH